MKPDCRMVAAKSSKDVRDKVGRTGRAGGEFQYSCQISRMINVTQCLFQVGKNMLEPLSQMRSASRQGDTADRANEQRHIQLGFQPPDLGSNGWLGKMKSPRGFRDFASLRNGQEGMQQSRT